MENNSYTLVDRINYLEFRQNLLILKQPCHKATVFFDLNIDIYLEIREKTNEFSEKIICGEGLKLYDYEKLIIGIWPNISNYPSACSLIAKSLLDKDVFNLIAE